MLDTNPPDVDGARETARRTIRDGNRASDVITRLRSLFSKKEFALEPLDLNEATREVIALSLSELQRNRVIVQSELADDLPSITGDRVQLQQVLLNLLRNASDAMAGVDDRPRQLLIRTESDGRDHVRVTVRDAGVGIERQGMDKLFDAFYTTKSGGMGIGLSVSRSIVERHDGRLWVEPNDGPGATFAFSIPRNLDGIADAARAIKTPLIREPSLSSLDDGEPSLGTVDIVPNRPPADTDGADDDPVNLDRNAPSVGRDPCKLRDAGQQRRVGLDVLEEVLCREPEQRRIRLTLGDLYRENGSSVHPPKRFEVPTVVNGRTFWHTHGFRLRLSRFDHTAVRVQMKRCSFNDIRHWYLLALPIETNHSSRESALVATTDQRASHRRRAAPLRSPGLRARGTTRRQ